MIEHSISINKSGDTVCVIKPVLTGHLGKGEAASYIKPRISAFLNGDGHITHVNVRIGDAICVIPHEMLEAIEGAIQFAREVACNADGKVTQSGWVGDG